MMSILEPTVFERGPSFGKLEAGFIFFPGVQRFMGWGLEERQACRNHSMCRRLLEKGGQQVKEFPRLSANFLMGALYRCFAPQVS